MVLYYYLTCFFVEKTGAFLYSIKEWRIKKMKAAWEIVHDCDDDNGEPACWAKEINHWKYGRFVWITRRDDTEYAVEAAPIPGQMETDVLMICRSLASAKRWVTMHVR